MHVINKLGDEWVKPGNIVGNGPFTLKEWKPQESLTVVANPKYWDAKSVKLSAITFLPIDDNLTAYNKYKAGEIDWSHGVPLALIDEVKLRPDYQVAPQVGTYYYIFNVTRKPFTDVRVRKALGMALNMSELVDKVTKGGQLATNAMVPAMAGYTPIKGNGYNVEEAKKLLAEAGFPGGVGFPKVTLLYNTSEGHKRIAEWAQENWKKNLGIEVALLNQEWATFLDTRQVSHNFDFTRAGWVGDYLDPNTFLDMFLTGSGLNDGLYSNPKYDELIKKAATMPAGSARMDTLRQAEEIMITQDQAVIPIYHYVEQDLIDLTKWEGWYANPLGSHHWKFIGPKK
jgi:oligopeptide transport system substrate-binding protein